MKKILFVIQELETGGAQRVCVNLANYFAEHGYLIRIAVLFHKKETIYALNPAVRVINVPPLRFGRFPAVAAFLVQLFFTGFIPNAVISFMWHANVFASIIAKISGIRCILSEHSNPDLAKNDRTLLAIGKKYFRYASKMIVLHQGALDYMIREMGMRQKQLSIIPNACMTYSSFSGKRFLNEPYLLAVGRLSPVKGFDRLIRMFAAISKQITNEHLVICGTGMDAKKLSDLAENLGLSEKVHFAGECKELAGMYQHADALVFTSHYEGWGNVIMEAMENGSPVIAFNCQYGPSEMIDNHKNGILIPQNNEEQFVSETVAYLNALPESRERYSQKAKLRMKDFSQEIVFPRWEMIIQLLW